MPSIKVVTFSSLLLLYLLFTPRIKKQNFNPNLLPNFNPKSNPNDQIWYARHTPPRHGIKKFGKVEKKAAS